MWAWVSNPRLNISRKLLQLGRMAIASWIVHGNISFGRAFWGLPVRLHVEGSAFFCIRAGQYESSRAFPADK